MRASYFTTPPPPLKQSPNKHPLFTSKFFSTKSFGPGHLVGAGMLVIGTALIAKAFVAHGQEAARMAVQPRRRPEDVAENERGEYGR
jgi:hypothetical protein